MERVELILSFYVKIETNRPDGSYATKDLFLRHPENEDWYKYIGRLDDTLVHILGEKTNPVPMELCIRGNSPYVAEGTYCCSLFTLVFSSHATNQPLYLELASHKPVV